MGAGESGIVSAASARDTRSSSGMYSPENSRFCVSKARKTGRIAPEPVGVMRLKWALASAAVKGMCVRAYREIRSSSGAATGVRYA